jgi:ribosomal protein L11 methyltransferase
MIQLIFDTRIEYAEQLSELLNDAGALAVTLQDAENEPLYEPLPGTTPLWAHTQVISLFNSRQDLNDALGRVTGALGDMPYRIETLADKDWVREGMDSFQPLQFGDRLWVCPGWCTPPDPRAVNLLLDPGLAFGTGTHATTALCLEWLSEADVQRRTVIDYGCGSGILAIAAAKLGAHAIWAVDHDVQALQATRANAARNGMAELIHVGTPNLPPACQADILLANILAHPLIELAPCFATLVKRPGNIVLSGILVDQAEQVCHAYRPYFDVSPPVQRDGWVRLDGTRKVS